MRTFSGPEFNGELVLVSADWHIVLPDGTALAGTTRCGETEASDHEALRPRPAADALDAAMTSTRASTRSHRDEIETRRPGLDRPTVGFRFAPSVGPAGPGGFVYETYLVG